MRHIVRTLSRNLRKDTNLEKAFPVGNLRVPIPHFSCFIPVRELPESFRKNKMGPTSAPVFCKESVSSLESSEKFSCELMLNYAEAFRSWVKVLG